MTLVKSKALSPKRNFSKLLKELPEDCSYEDMQYYLYVLQKIERGLKEANEKKTYSTEEMKIKLKKWLKK